MENHIISLSLSLIYWFFNKHAQSTENHTCLRGHLRSDHLSPPLPPYYTNTFIPYILYILSHLYSHTYYNITSKSLFTTINGSLLSVHLSFTVHCWLYSTKLASMQGPVGGPAPRSRGPRADHWVPHLPDWPQVRVRASPDLQIPLVSTAAVWPQGPHLRSLLPSLALLIRPGWL